MLFRSMSDLMGNMHGEINPELTLRYDYENFESPPSDAHPSKLCHEVMAIEIIKQIEKRGLL